jgi:hypothetical protein
LLEDLGIVGPALRVRSLRKLADDALYCQTRWMRNRTTCESMLIHTHRRTRSPGLSRLVLRLGRPGIDSVIVMIYTNLARRTAGPAKVFRLIHWRNL